MRHLRALGVLAVALALAGVAVRLGLWQVSRHEQRQRMVAEHDSAMRAEPHRFDPAGDSLAALEGRRVELHGHWRAASSILLSARIHDGGPGVHLVSVLVLEDSSTVLVDRGWVAADDARTADPTRFAAAGPQRVLGLVEALPAGVRGPAWTALDSLGMRAWSVHAIALDSARARTGLALRAALVHALPQPELRGEPVRRAPRPDDPMKHFWYAVQWFAVAAIALGTGLALARRLAAMPADSGAQDPPRGNAPTG